MGTLALPAQHRAPVAAVCGACLLEIVGLAAGALQARTGVDMLCAMQQRRDSHHACAIGQESISSLIEIATCDAHSGVGALQTASPTLHAASSVCIIVAGTRCTSPTAGVIGTSLALISTLPALVGAQVVTIVAHRALGRTRALLAVDIALYACRAVVVKPVRCQARFEAIDGALRCALQWASLTLQPGINIVV